MIRKCAVLFFLIILLVACNDINEPQVYSTYAGSWKCDETSSVSGFVQPYVVVIDRNSKDTSQYLIRNIFDLGDNQMIVVRIEGDSVALLQQPTTGHVLQSFSGNSIPYTSIKLFYTIYDGERDVFFEAVYSRK